MKSKRHDIFVSYARRDGRIAAEQIHKHANAQGFKVWRDVVGLEGNREWWPQIKEAIEDVTFMILVLTTGAGESDIVRKEWRYARQQGVCVYLVKGTADLDFKTLPRWMSGQQIYDWFDPLEQQKLVNDLKKTPDLKRVPFIADDLPKDFVPRPGEFDQLIGHLLSETREDPVAITAALRGAGGYGKTTLAKAVCHDERIQDAFDDGILWVTLGATPGDLNAKVLELIEVLSGQKPDYISTEAVAARFRELLADRKILLVIDDVWNHAHLRPFMQGGDCCARLITTRNPNTLPDRAAGVKVDAMRESEAVALLGAGLRDGEKEGQGELGTGRAGEMVSAEWLAALKLLAARLGKWPLLLRLANGVLRSRTKSGEVLPAAINYANRALDKRGLKAFDANNPVERNQAVSATLAVSLNQLSDEDRARFFELAIFPEDIYVPMVTLERYWRLDDLDTDDLCDRLHQFSLLLEFDLGMRLIRLHDVFRTIMRDERKSDLAALNRQLLDAHRPVEGWGVLPPSLHSEPYFWEHLAAHLIEADCGEELVATVKDWRYLAKKTLLRKSPSVEKDLLQALPFAPETDPLRTLLRGYSASSHLFNHCETLPDVEANIYSRLKHFEELKAAIEDLARLLKSVQIAPVHELPDLPHPALLRTLEGHSSSVRSCTFSHDSKHILSASDDRTLKVWDAASGELLRTIEGHSSSVRSCAFSHDSKYILSASDDRTLKVWDAASGELLRTIEGHSSSVRSCAFSHDSKHILSASDDRTLKVWDAASGKLLRTLEGHSSSVRSCAFSPDFKRILSASDDRRLKVWDAASGELLRTLEGHSSSVRSCAFSHDSKYILSASDDRRLKVWDAASGKLLRTIEGHSSSVRSCAFSHDSKYILSASDDRTLKVWDAASGELLRTLEGHSSSALGCAFSHDSKYILSAFDDRTLKVWDAASGELLRTLEGHSSFVSGCAFSHDSKCILSASYDRTLKVWDAASGELLRTLEGHSSSALGCAFSPDSKHILSASDDCTLKVWDAASGELLRTLEGHSSSVRSCTFSHDSKHILSASDDRTLKVWDAASGELLRTLEGHSSFVLGCAFSPDSKHILSASYDRTLKVWDAASGELLRTLEGHSSSVLGHAFSPNSKCILSASDDRTLKVWDADTGELLRTLKGHSSFVRSCVFSPDSKHILSASSDRTLKVWDADTGECLATFFADGELLCCAMHGDLIVAGGARGVYFLKLVR